MEEIQKTISNLLEYLDEEGHIIEIPNEIILSTNLQISSTMYSIISHNNEIYDILNKINKDYTDIFYCIFENDRAQKWAEILLLHVNYKWLIHFWNHPPNPEFLKLAKYGILLSHKAMAKLQFKEEALLKKVQEKYNKD